MDSGTANDSRIVAEHNTFPRQSRGRVVGFCCNNPDELHVFWMELSNSAIDTLSGNIHFFVLQITGFVSVCSQLWELKNAGFYPLFSICSQVWELFGKGTESRHDLEGYFWWEKQRHESFFSRPSGGHSNRLGDRLT
jgi:hypothetical protein